MLPRRRTEPTLLSAVAGEEGWGRLFQDVQVRAGASSTQTSDINIALVAAQTKEVCLAFGDNRPLLLQGHGPRHGPQWEQRPGPYHGLRWHHQIHQAAPYYPGLSSSGSLHYTHILLLFLFHFSTTFLLFLVAPEVSGCLGVWGYLKNGLRVPCCVAGVIPGMVCLLGPTLLWTGVHLGLVPLLEPSGTFWASSLPRLSTSPGGGGYPSGACLPGL